MQRTLDRMWNDPRFVLMILAGEAVEATGAMLLELWRRGARTGRLRRVLQTLESRGWVQRTGDGPIEDRIFRLSGTGRSALAGPVDPETLWTREWDGRWRFVLFDVPQDRSRLRDRLRRRLRDMRCGWLQNSVWVTPDPLDAVKALIADNDYSVESLLLLEGRPAGGETDVDVVRGAWDFGAVAAAHAAYLRIAGSMPDSKPRGRELPAWELWLRSETRAWCDVVQSDPFLPQALWPDGYNGRTVWAARLRALRRAGDGLADLARRST